MDKLNMNSMVEYNSSSDSVSYTTDGSTDTLTWDYWRYYPDTIREYYPYPVYYGTTRYEDTYKKAFSIAKLLLKEKLLVSRKLKDFIGLVEKIAKEL